jgi:hypothetical protein
MSVDCRFHFIPRLPTAEAYNNMAFGDYHSISTLFSALNKWEAEKKMNLEGYIYFKEGYEANYPNGTMKIYNNPRWWESGAKSCVKGCCTWAPEGYVIGTVTPKTGEVRQHWPKKWQEFRRVCGPGGLEEQFKEIKNKEGIDKIWLKDYGWFWVSVI